MFRRYKNGINKISKEESKMQSRFCQYRSRCTDFKKKCYKCKLNGLNKKRSYFE